MDKTNIEATLLKTMLAIYILLAFILAGLNFGYAEQAPAHIATLLIWAFFTGRGYCFYCPLGTVTALLGRIAGQQIKTDLTECIKCRKYNQVCPMAIDILSCAREATFFTLAKFDHIIILR